jgi:hypothetical protein
MSTAECTKVDNGLLVKGLKTAIVSVALKSSDIISAWDATKKTDLGNIIIIIIRCDQHHQLR